MKKELTKFNFPDYNICSYVSIAYLDLVEKIFSVVDKIEPVKDIRIKNNTQDWFDDSAVKAINLREKCLKNFKSTKLHIDQELSKESKYLAMKLIQEKKNLQRKIKRKHWETKGIVEISKILRLAL